LGEMFAVRSSPCQAGDKSESVAVNSYPRLLAVMLAQASSMVGVRPPKLPSKVTVVKYCNKTCAELYLLADETTSLA